MATYMQGTATSDLNTTNSNMNSQQQASKALQK